MRFKLCLVLALVTFCLAKISKDDKDKEQKRQFKKAKEGLVTGAKGAHELYKGLDTGKVVDIVKGVSTIASIIPGPVGGVFSGLSLILGFFGGEAAKSDPALIEISEKLSQLGKEVSKVHDAVEKAIQVIKVEVRGLRLKDVTAKLHVLQEVYQRLVEQKSPKSIADFLRSCGSIHEKPIFLANFIARDTYKYKQQVMSENNETTYVELVQNVQRLMYQATILESACSAVEHRNALESERENIEKHIVANAQKYFSQINEAVKGDAKFYVFDAAKNIIEQYVPKHMEEKNSPFGDRLYRLMTTSLPSGQFFLTVYEGKQSIDLYHQHYPNVRNETVRIDTKPEPSYFHHWNEWNRNIVLIRKGTSPPYEANSNDPTTCAKRLPKYSYPCGQRDSKQCFFIHCPQWVAETRECLKQRKSVYIALGCFHGSHFERATFQTGRVFQSAYHYVPSQEIHGEYVIF